MRDWLYTLYLLLVGCGAAGAGEMQDGAIVDGSTTDGAAIDSASPDGMGVDAPPDGGACHGYGFGAPAATIRQVSSLPPVTGGQIQPGNYDAVDGQTTGAITGTIRSTWVITASTVDSYEQLTLTGTPPPPLTRSFGFTTGAMRLVRTATCGGTMNFDNEYSARMVGSDVFLDVKQSTIMFTFKRR